MEGFLVGWIGSGLQEAVFNRLLNDLPAIESFAVIDDANDDLISLVISVEVDCSGLRFAERPALLGHLDAVVDGIADDVDEGIADLFNDGFIEFGFFTGNDQVDVFFPSSCWRRGRDGSFSGKSGEWASCAGTSPGLASPW